MNRSIWLLPAFLFLAPTVARGGAKDFVPRLIGYSGNLILESHYISEAKKTDGGASSAIVRNSTSAFRQTMEIGVYGYSYHPDFFLFSIVGSGELGQFVDRPSDKENSTSQDASEEYDFRGYLLRRKPLHAEMYFDRDRPFLTGDYNDDPLNKNTRTGLELFYDKRPYHSSLEYYNEQNAFNQRERNSDDYITRFNFHQGSFAGSLSGHESLDNTDSYDDAGGKKAVLKTNSTTLESYVNWFKDIYNLSTNTSWSEFKSNNEALFDQPGITKAVSRVYNVQLNGEVELPWDFVLHNDMSQFNSNTHNGKIATSVESYSQQKVNKIDFKLTQELFSSLKTKMSADFTDNTSDSGKIDSTDPNNIKPENARNDAGSYRTSDYELSTNYIKKVWGGAIRGSLASYIKRTTQQGVVTIGGEKNPEEFTRLASGLNDPYMLLRPDADIANVRVEIKVVGVDLWQSLPTTDYAVAGNPPQVIINNLSAVTNKENVGTGPPAYKFRVTYSTLAADYTLQDNTGVASIGIDLFSGVVQADYSHSYSSQDIIDGDPLNYTNSAPVKNDYFSLNYLKNALHVNANYRITNTDYKEQELAYSVGYNRPVKILKSVHTSFNVRYFGSGVDYTSADEKNYSSESRFTSRVNNSFTIPWQKIGISHYISYQRNRGNVTKTTQNSRGFYSRNKGISVDESDHWVTGGSLSMHLPFTKIPLSLNGSYGDEKFVNGTDVVTTSYVVNSRYSWRFGGTTISMDGKFTSDIANSKNGMDENKTIDDDFEFNVTLTRRLF